MAKRTRTRTPGQALKAARLSAGLTQDDLAAQLGIEQPQISRMEAGKGESTVRVWLRTMRALGLAVDDLA